MIFFLPFRWHNLASSGNKMTRYHKQSQEICKIYIKKQDIINQIIIKLYGVGIILTSPTLIMMLQLTYRPERTHFYLNNLHLL